MGPESPCQRSEVLPESEALKPETLAFPNIPKLETPIPTPCSFSSFHLQRARELGSFCCMEESNTTLTRAYGLKTPRP